MINEASQLPTMVLGETTQVVLGLIRPNLVALRPPQVESEEFQDLMRNIKQLGEILQPLRARLKEDPETKEAYLELTDGLQRYTIAGMLEMETVPVRLSDADDMRTLVEQVALNANRVTTRPAQFAQQLLRIIEEKPAITVAELAEMCGQSESWVNQRLALTKLVKQIQEEFVDAGAIKVANAYQLSRLPQDNQPDFVESAQTLNNTEFTAMINARLKEIRAANAAGRDPSKRGVFTPVPTLRKASEVKASEIEDILAGFEAEAVDTPEKAAKAVLDWVLQMDPASVAAQKERYELQKRKKQEDQIARQKERAEKLSTDAAEKAAQLRKEMGLE